MPIRTDLWVGESILMFQLRCFWYVETVEMRIDFMRTVSNQLSEILSSGTNFAVFENESKIEDSDAIRYSLSCQEGFYRKAVKTMLRKLCKEQNKKYP